MIFSLGENRWEAFFGAEIRGKKRQKKSRS